MELPVETKEPRFWTTEF